MRFSGTRLQNLRRKRGMRAADVARALGIARTTVTMWEADESQPNSDRLLALARFLRVDMKYFFVTDEKYTPVNMYKRRRGRHRSVREAPRK